MEQHAGTVPPIVHVQCAHRRIFGFFPVALPQPSRAFHVGLPGEEPQIADIYVCIRDRLHVVRYGDRVWPTDRNTGEQRGVLRKYADFAGIRGERALPLS